MELESLTTCTSRNDLRLGRNRGHRRWWQSCRGGGGERRAWVRSLQWEYQKGGARAARSACFFVVVFVVVVVDVLFFRSFHSSQLCNPKKKKKKKTQVRKLPREDHTCGRGRDPGGSAIYLTRIPASLDRTLNPTLEMSPNLLRILKEEWTDFGLRPERERLKNKKWLARFWKVIVKWIDGKFNRDWEGKVRVLEREREQLTIRVLQRKKWEK